MFTRRVTGYTPIALSIERQPFVIVRTARYPTPEVYHFKPLNERVRVFQRPFCIVQDLVVDASRNAQAAVKDRTALTIKGALSYHACDAKVCFTPQSVPLTWSVDLRQLDRERAKP